MLGRVSLMVALAGAFVCAQDDQAEPRVADAARKPAFVRVIDAAGKAIEAAEVVFCGSTLHVGPQWLPPDVVRAVSDGRGRARADLLSGRCYVAWAVGPPDEGGARQASILQGWTGAAVTFDLVCNTPVRSATSRCTGGDAWAALGPIRWVVVGRFVGVEQELQADDQGKVQMPPLPEAVLAQCVVEARTKGGEALWRALASRASFELPPPCTLELEAVDAGGQPIAGAEIRHRVGRQSGPALDLVIEATDEVMRTVGVTGADGRVSVQVPYVGDPFDLQRNDELLLFVHAKGKVRAATGFRQKALYVGDAQVAVPESRRLRCTLVNATPIEGQVIAAPGRPVTGLRVLLQAPTTMRTEQGVQWPDGRTHVADVAADGRFVFDDVPDNVRSTWMVLLPPAGGDPLALPAIPAQNGRNVPTTIALAKQVTLRLRMRDEVGGPATGAMVFLISLETRGSLARGGVRAVLGPAGAVDLAVMPGRWGVLALSDRGFWAEEIVAEAAELKLEHALAAMPTMRLRLLDADGAPVAGARMQIRATSSAGSSGGLQSLMQQLSRRPMTAPNLATNADGDIAIPMLPVQGYTMRFVLTRDGKQTDMMPFEATAPGDPPVEVRFR